MSLDVCLTGPETEKTCICTDCGHEHTRKQSETLFESNITHNLNTMAEAAGIYQALWRPEELNATTAEQLIAPLTEGLKLLRAEPEKFKAFDAKNGWGTYEQFIPWVVQYLEACKEHPLATVKVSR